MFKLLTGLTITKVRSMTAKEMRTESWNKPSIVLELSDGTILYLRSSDESNSPGILIRRDKEGSKYAQAIAYRS